MSHNHSHSEGDAHGGHNHSVTAAQAGSKAFIIGIVLNLIYVIAEAGAGLWTNSLALLTDVGHNLSDVASLIISLFAFRLARMKPTDTFTYGFKKSTILAALVNAVVLLIAIGIIGYETFQRIGHPRPLEGGVIAWIAGIGIVINGISAMLFFRSKDELNSKSAYLHLLADALVSAGVVVAGIIISYTHWYWLDTAVSAIVLVVILIGTWSLLTDSLRLTLDAVPRNVNMEKVTQSIEKVTGVVSVSHVHVWAMSTSENALTAHVTLSVSDQEQNKIVANIKHELQHQNIQHATIETSLDSDPQGSGTCETNTHTHH